MELQGIVKGFSMQMCMYLNKNYSQIYTNLGTGGGQGRRGGEVRRRKGSGVEKRGDFSKFFRRYMHCIIDNFRI